MLRFVQLRTLVLTSHDCAMLLYDVGLTLREVVVTHVVAMILCYVVMTERSISLSLREWFLSSYDAIELFPGNAQVTSLIITSGSK